MIIKNSTGLSLVKITFDQSNVKKNVGRKMRQSVFQMKPFTRIYVSLVLVLVGYYLAQGSIKVNCILQISWALEQISETQATGRQDRKKSFKTLSVIFFSCTELLWIALFFFRVISSLYFVSLNTTVPFIDLLGRAFKGMKNGVYFIEVAF